MLKFGNISEVEEISGRARVELDEYGLVTNLLPVVSVSTNEIQSRFMPEIGSQVAVIFNNQSFDDGIIVGATYGPKSPDKLASGQYGFAFPNGGKIVYNINTGTAHIIAPGGVEIKSAAESLKQIMSDLIDAILAETHPVTAVGSPTGTPLNFVQYQAIKARLDALFS